MADIVETVSRAFASTRDIRQNYTTTYLGSSSLLSGSYDTNGSQAAGFYQRPDITGNGDSAKLAIIYGEVMITPYLIDAGVESSTNDPASILKTYRFITGDGENSGIPNGPNGTPLELSLIHI